VRVRASNLLLVLAGVTMSVALAEGATLFLLAHPGLARSMPGPVLRHLQDCYREYDRPIIQMQKDTARYDPQLYYTLRPGRFVFRTREFANEFRVNHLGVRDDEASLAAPEVVVIGDSYAMGWGVEQDEAFPQVIERRRGTRVLNAAVSSYGTVREMWMLDRIDVSGTKQLIVQYAENDRNENEVFRATGTLPPINEEMHRRMLADDAARRRYWFGKYSLRLLTHGLEPPPRADPTAATSAAAAFVHALVHAGHQPLDTLELTVLMFTPPDFPPALAAYVRAHPELPAWVRHMRPVFAGDTLRDGHTYVLDEHVNALGHAAIAEALMQAMAAPPTTP
jgi:hypothetical protein